MRYAIYSHKPATIPSKKPTLRFRCLLVYDTGASYTTMRPATTRHLRIIDSSNRIIAPGARQGQALNMNTAGGQRRMRRINNVELSITVTGEVSRGAIMLHDGLAGPPLLGVDHIKGFKLLKVKFRRQ